MEIDVRGALRLLDEYILYSVNNKTVLYFFKKNEKILITNVNLTTILSYNDFVSQFSDSKFSIYKKINEYNEEDILNDYRPLRQ